MERFWSKVNKTETCWEWTAYLRNGYGRFWDGAKQVNAHTYSFELACGPLLKGKIVCHRCDNPKCVRPDHLFEGSYADNTADAIQKGRHKPPTPTTVKAHGEQHYLHKLTEEQVRYVKQSSLSAPKLAARYGVSKTAIRHIRIGVSWKHVS